MDNWCAPASFYNIEQSADKRFRSDISSTISDFTNVDMPSPTRSVSDLAELGTGNRTPTRTVSKFSFIDTTTSPAGSAVASYSASEDDASAVDTLPHAELVRSKVSVNADSEAHTSNDKLATNDASKNGTLLENAASGVDVASNGAPEQNPTPSGQSHSATMSAHDQATWKAINEQAGGSIKRYHELTIEKINSGPRGVILPPETAIPEPGELIGDQIPGYEKMSVGSRVLCWWTNKQRRIFNASIVQDVSNHY